MSDDARATHRCAWRRNRQVRGGTAPNRNAMQQQRKGMAEALSVSQKRDEVRGVAERRCCQERGRELLSIRRRGSMAGCPCDASKGATESGMRDHAAAQTPASRSGGSDRCVSQIRGELSRCSGHTQESRGDSAAMPGFHNCQATRQQELHRCVMCRPNRARLAGPCAVSALVEIAVVHGITEDSVDNCNLERNERNAAASQGANTCGRTAQAEGGKRKHRSAPLSPARCRAGSCPSPSRAAAGPERDPPPARTRGAPPRRRR